MCGINGFVSIQKLSEHQINATLQSMNDKIIHRGPDDQGIYSKLCDEYSIAMGMTRLSIIDLTTGHQPMFSDNQKIVIVFNGEIYNYRELKSELENQEVQFHTTSDTEVILRLYEKYGTTFFERLDGMFAFSIYDQEKEKLYIVRDFFGEKPLYFTKNENKFIWASELKSLTNNLGTVPPIDQKGLNLYFRLTYIPAPYTIYKDVYKLNPYHYLTYDLRTQDYDIQPIEMSDARKEVMDIPKDEAVKNVRDLVQESVVSRSVSDVPIGAFLSGGVDSSVVSLCLAKSTNTKINTFSIGFEKATYDESDKARTVAKLIGSNHYEYILKEGDLEDNIDRILLNFDEPFADSSSLPTYLVSNKTAGQVKVALTGDGGDEVFGGYNKYYMGDINAKYTRVVPQGIHNLAKKTMLPFLYTKDDSRGTRYRIKRILQAIDYSGNYYWDIISLGYAGDSLKEYFLPEVYLEEPFSYYKEKTGIKSPKNLHEYRAVDRHMSLEGDMLVKVDRTSMLNSLECRAPFLNKKIWNYANCLPTQYLMNGYDKKHILKEAFKKDFPEGFLDKTKSGFGVPVGDWLRSSLKKDLEKYIEDTFLNTQNIFKSEAIKKLVRDHLNGKDNTFMVWTFYCFQKWYKEIYLQG